MNSRPETYVIGDIHGQLEKLIHLLKTADLISDNLQWKGGAARLWFTGDFCDRGPNGLGVLSLVRRLQQEAVDSGGSIGAVAGNHEIMLLGSLRFGEQRGPWGEPFPVAWRRNGGRVEDLLGLTGEQARWIAQLPAIVRMDGHLLLHADAAFYLRYGQTIDQVNTAIRTILLGDDITAWSQLLEAFTERRTFLKSPQTAQRILELYGGSQIVHGHTPIEAVGGGPSREVREPVVYARGLCVNVDGGMYLGGPGFVYRLP